MASNKEMRKLARDAKKSGYEVTKTGSGHFRVVAPSGEILILPFSPGTSSSEHMAKAEYRKFKRGVQSAG